MGVNSLTYSTKGLSLTESLKDAASPHIRIKSVSGQSVTVTLDPMLRQA